MTEVPNTRYPHKGKTQVNRDIDEQIVPVESDFVNPYSTKKTSIFHRRVVRNLEHAQKAGREVDLDLEQNRWRKEALQPVHRTLLLPSLLGQARWWKSQIRRRADMADRVIQFGNIVGTHPNAIDPVLKKHGTVYNGNSGLVQALIVYYASTHDGWEQLAGTNEMAAIFAEDVYLVSERAAMYLAESWFEPEGSMKVAAVVDGKLATHAGLTYGQWIEIGSPLTAQEAADRLNEKYKGVTEFDDCYQLSGVPNFAADPIWADVYMETLPSWVTAPHECPFGQVHSKAGVHMSAGKNFIKDEKSYLFFLDRIGKWEIQRFGSTVTIRDTPFISIEMNIPEHTEIRRWDKAGFLEYYEDIH